MSFVGGLGLFEFFVGILDGIIIFVGYVVDLKFVEGVILIVVFVVLMVSEREVFCFRVLLLILIDDFGVLD